MIWIIWGTVTVIIACAFFFIGAAYGVRTGVELMDQQQQMVFIDQAQCRIKDNEMSAVVDHTASFASVKRLDSTGAETIITINHN